MEKKRKLLGAWILLICFIPAGCRTERPAPTAALFSWNAGAVKEQDRLFRSMEEHRLGVLYQNISKDLELETLTKFFAKASEQGTDVYFLTGDPQWALQEDGHSLCAEIDRAAGISRALTDGELKGVLIDVEPYLLEEWKKGDGREVMGSFVGGMKAAYDRAQEQGLEVILCIPYFFDSKGYEEELETLIGACCDRAAVMNYYRGKEAEHIRTEAALAKKYDKGLISIYELKAPGSHGLTEKNTYYAEGLQAVEENFAQLREAYPEQEITMALHDFEALQEVAEHE